MTLGGTRLLVNMARRAQQSQSGTKIDLQIKNTEIAIIYPSLCCPLIVKSNEPFSIIIGTDMVFDKFYRDNYSNWDAIRSVLDFEVDDDPSDWVTPLAVRRFIGKHLKIKPWKDAIYTGKVNDIKQDTPFFTPEKATQNLACRKLEIEDGRLYAYTWDNNKKHRDAEIHFANLREDTLSFYRQQGIKYFYQIDIWNTNLTPGELYDIAWISKDDSIYLNKEMYLERQDYYTQDKYLKKDKYIPQECRNGFDLCTGPLNYEPDEQLPVQNYHPIWVASQNKKRLSIGHLTDVHVSARQHAFKKSQARLIPGQSEPIGEMCNASYDTLKDLMDQFGNDPDIDVLFFTGDLIDYGRNYNPKDFVNGMLDKTGELWDAMVLDNMNLRKPDGTAETDSDGAIKPNIDNYPRGLDHLTVYSMFIYFYKKYKKPILLISGNHEAYTLPYGISPRAKLGRGFKDNLPQKNANTHEELVEESTVQAKEDRQAMQNGKTPGELFSQRANEGIPADHNLTIPEATLMYGPDFARVVAGGAYTVSGEKNFRKANFDWFYNIFTPFSDFAIPFEQQCLIGLEWGDDEAFVAMLDGQAGIVGSMLPRSTKSINKHQKKLIEQALEYQRPCTMLFTH
ncbi:MAG: metallophosphoesterase, partial [Thioalkalispiraceae bacterium]